jgi:hypothetical protein
LILSLSLIDAGSFFFGHNGNDSFWKIEKKADFHAFRILMTAKNEILLKPTS